MTVTYRTSFLSSVTLNVTGSCLLRPTSTPTSTPTNTPSAPADLAVAGSCSNVNTSTATFIVTNNGGDMDSPYAYEIKDAQGAVVDTGNFQLQAGGSVVINYSGTSSSYTFSSPDDASLNAKSDMTACLPPPPPPSLTAAGSCSSNGQATFVITNSGGDMPTFYSYEITDASGASVQATSFQLGAGQSITINVSGNSTAYNLSSPQDANLTATADMRPCAPPPPSPSLTVSGACTANTGEATFVVTNNGGAMTAPYTYNIADANGTIVQSAAFQLGAGQSITVKVAGSSNEYSFSSPDDAALNAKADMTLCAPPPPPPPAPSLTATGVCSATNTAKFVITNSGGDMPTPYTYLITDVGGATVQSATFQLTAGQSTTITVSGNSTLYTLTSPDDSKLIAQADMTACATPPANPILSASGACTSNAGQATFVVTNNGGNMTAPYTYTITDANGTVVQTATFQLSAGQSTTIVVTGSSSSYTLASPNDSALTATADMTACVTPPPPPNLTATGACTSNAGVATFNITNNGGAMPVGHLYTITDASGNVIQSGSFILGAGETFDITVTGPYDELILTITDAKNVTTRAAMTSCNKPITSVAPAEPGICIQCLVFHTFRDDNLEIYRLDGIEGQPDAKLYNLSKDGATDSRPSRAPNDSWVVFQSDRDGNVELYYTDLVGSGEAIRLTETESNNTNPMYGPDSNTVVFQSDRNGRFDLFTIDQATGKETQITSDPADDINAFYSPDLKWIVYQSNRNNNWDLFVLNVETGTEAPLTDSPADEVFPAWSPNGKYVAFLVDDNGATDLYVIDLDTLEVQRLTADGKTNNATWSPEGDRIAYQSERNGNLDIYSFDLTKNEEYRVTDYEGVDSGPTWDCGGTNLAFTSIRDGDPNVFQVFWKGGPAGNMTIDPATDKWSQWRPSNDVSSTGY